MEKEACEEKRACDTCESSSMCSDKVKDDHEMKRLEQKLFHIRHKIMVMSGKGGVGKSTVAINLAASLALQNYQVGILDADIHGPNVPKMLGVDKQHLLGREDGVDPVQVFRNFKAVSMGLLAQDPDKAIVWRGPLKHAAIKQFLGNVNWGDLDFLLIDLPPGTGDEPLSVANLIKSVDGAIIVTTPQDVALLDSRKAVNFSRLLKVPVLGIVENMAGLICPHCGERIDLFKVGGGEKAAQGMGVPFLGRIPIDQRVVEMCDSGEPFVADSTESEAGEAFRQLTRRVLDVLEPARDKEKRAVN
jgi:ATP-binding protein involved in chromosome partitioning